MLGVPPRWFEVPSLPRTFPHTHLFRACACPTFLPSAFPARAPACPSCQAPAHAFIQVLVLHHARPFSATRNKAPEHGGRAASRRRYHQEVSERMRRLRTKGRTLTLKILRAVANAPEGHMKGSIGHGVCDHLTRSLTLSAATDAPRVLQREAVRLLADLNVPADQIRGVGVGVILNLNPYP